MFGNRGYGWKLGAALALIAGLGVYSGTRGNSINPSVWRCLAEPRRWDGTRLWVPGARIVDVRKRDYEILSGIARIRVAGPSPAEVDSSIALIAVFHGDGPFLEPVQTRILPQGSWRRRVMEIVSVLVALGVFANFGRHFLFRPKSLQAGGGTD